MLRPKVDPDRNRHAGRGAEYDPVSAADNTVGAIELSPPRVSVVIVENRGSPPVPAPAHFDTHSRTSDEVFYVITGSAVLGNQPEHITVEAIADRSQAPLCPTPIRTRSRPDRADLFERQTDRTEAREAGDEVIALARVNSPRARSG